RKEEVPHSVAAESAGLVVIAANKLTFDKKLLKLPASKPVDLQFHNLDKGVPHNVALYANDTAQQAIFKGPVVVGPITADYKFTAPPAGTYYFHCDVHPNMAGAVTAA